jgi:hypothetical protein
MDSLAIVAERTRKLEEIAELYDAALLARNESICDARADRHGPTAIAAVANLNVESVRRIYNAPRGKLTRAAARSRRARAVAPRGNPASRPSKTS